MTRAPSRAAVFTAVARLLNEFMLASTTRILQFGHMDGFRLLRTLRAGSATRTLGGRANPLPPYRCLLQVSTDYEAILAWLKSKRGLSTRQLAAHRARALGAAHGGAGEGTGQGT